MDGASTRTALPAELWLQPLDRARAELNRVLLASPLAPQLVRKDRRIALRAVLGISVALVLTLRAPVALYALAPIVLGVPHLAADLRYLVLQPRWSRIARAALVVGCVPFVVLRLLPLIGVRFRDAPIEMAMGAAALLVAAVAAGVSARRYRRLALVLPALGALAVVALRRPEAARLVFAHLHNVVALVVWAFLFRARRDARATLLVPIACALVATALVLGYGASFSEAAMARPRSFGLSLATLGGWLAPGLALRWAVPIALSYVFLQSIHYSVWLGLVPAEKVRGDAGRSFRMSFRALVRDFGTLGLGVVALMAAATFALATRDLHVTRDTYLSLSAFHGYLELAVIVIVLCGRRDVMRA